MASEPLPDHWKALGLDKSADASTIKATYRKLVLKCHPDKVTDPALKEQKQEEFHKIQQAYECLIDDDARGKYEAELSLAQLRREGASRRAAGASADKTSRFDVPTKGGATMRATGPTRYSTEERRPSRAYDEEEKFYDERGSSSRSKYDTYPAFPKSSASPQSKRSEKESSSKSSRTTSDRTRSDRNKTRDREERRERKFNSVEDDSSSADEKARYEAEYKRRSAEDDMRRQTAEARRKAEERRSYEDPRYGATPSTRKLNDRTEEALRYLHKSRAQVEEEIRPPAIRASSRDKYSESSRSSRKESRPEAVRRSSAVRPTKERTSSSGRDRDSGRGIPEIVEFPRDEFSQRRQPPSMKHSSSSPAEIEVPRGLSRAYTDGPRSTNAPPGMHRSATMPTVPHVSSSSRRKEGAAPRPSALRETMTPEEPASASKTKYYHYSPSGGSVQMRPEEVSSGGHRTILREPERQYHRSPSPLGRPPIGANRPADANIKATRPSMPPRTSSSRNVSPVRGRERPLYGEVHGENHRPRQASYSPHDVQYTKRYGPDDIRWSPRGRESERNIQSQHSAGPQPGFTRTLNICTTQAHLQRPTQHHHSGIPHPCIPHFVIFISFCFIHGVQGVVRQLVQRRFHYIFLDDLQGLRCVEGVLAIYTI